MSNAADQFDDWIRGRFVELNSELEACYGKLEDSADIVGVGDVLKQALVEEGERLVAPVAAEGNTERHFESAYDVLGNVGLYMAALRRHEITNPERDDRSPFASCSALAMHIAASIGVAPRFATPHLTTHNFARNGQQKSFTNLADEKLFNELNLEGILGYKRAGKALMRLSNIGISAPAAGLLLRDAKDALEGVVVSNKNLFDALDPQTFFNHVRPYYKPHHVGSAVYRGGNAGDFAGINQLDLLLGLCRGNDPDYARILEEKILFMTPEDQMELRACLARRPLLDELLEAAKSGQRDDGLSANALAFLDVCEAHGRTAAQHHDMLVKKFIRRPAEEIEQRHLKQITASGPPLDELIASLEWLRDLRMAKRREGAITAHDDMALLRDWFGC